MLRTAGRGKLTDPTDCMHITFSVINNCIFFTKLITVSIFCNNSCSARKSVYANRVAFCYSRLRIERTMALLWVKLPTFRRSLLPTSSGPKKMCITSTDTTALRSWKLLVTFTQSEELFSLAEILQSNIQRYIMETFMLNFNPSFHGIKLLPKFKARISISW